VSFLTVVGTWYFLVALLLTMNAFRWLARQATWRLLRVKRDERGRPLDNGGLRASLAFLLQSILIVGVGLPLATAAMLVYRVKVYSAETPDTAADCPYQAVNFDAGDGTRLAGWWVPAIPQERPRRLTRGIGPHARHQTVLMCGGFGDTMTSYAGIMRTLVADGYNVLAFDLRANGQSAGTWAGFGATERRDVLGALGWVKQQHADEAERVYAVGFGIGGAAVIGAATDESGEGNDIDAIAVFGTYARFKTMADELMEARLTRPLKWMADHVALPIASAHAGVDLSTCGPADEVGRLWPRPLLVLHGRADHAVPFSEGEDLFRAATFPKESLWLPNDHAGVYRNRDAARALLRFFENARRLPAV
jgi:alpha-beta hydrolase superfamily lysophospholipase